MSESLLTIDGAQGEGGGQILRTSLALSMCLGKAFELTRIRANRSNPGLQPQHLASVMAAKSISRADVEGAQQGSQRLVFIPQRVMPGDYTFPIATAGSTTLVLQAVLAALMLAKAPSNLRLEGGTRNPLAPPYEFISESFLPLIHRMGPTITTRLERPGFAPRGGGIMHATIHPVKELEALSIRERGEILHQGAEVQRKNRMGFINLFLPYPWIHVRSKRGIPIPVRAQRADLPAGLEFQSRPCVGFHGAGHHKNISPPSPWCVATGGHGRCWNKVP